MSVSYWFDLLLSCGHSNPRRGIQGQRPGPHVRRAMSVGYWFNPLMSLDHSNLVRASKVNVLDLTYDVRELLV